MPKILLQSFETGLYLDLVGAWTSSPALARDFLNCVKATEFKIQRRLTHAFVVVLPEPGREAKAPGPRGRAATLAGLSPSRFVGWGKPAASQKAKGGRTATGHRP